MAPWWLWCFLSLLGSIDAFSDANVTVYRRTNSRQSRFYPVIVQLRASQCTTNDGITGICILGFQCTILQGTQTTTCLKGLGTCCIRPLTCGQTMTTNLTNFVNPGYPSSYVNPMPMCNLRIQRLPGVCQVRLDFIQNELAPPTTMFGSEGQCLNDNMTITGARPRAPPAICASNTGQHMYLDFGTGNEININFALDTTVAFQRRWNILVTQIPCDSPSRAIDGCLQYYPERTGQVRIFGYKNIPHLANLDYTFCVRRAADASSITWSECPGGDNFFMTGYNDFSMPDPINTRGAATDFGCTVDYITMTGVTMMNAVNMMRPVRFCGGYLNVNGDDGTTNSTPPILNSASVTSNSVPFKVDVVTNEEEIIINDMGNTGFCLQYTQS